MSAQADDASPLAFAFQARRFACDRCHRYKLKCERGPLIMSSGIATPLGPCKRCGKAGTECTSSNATTATSSRRRKTNTAGSSADLTTATHKMNSQDATSSSTDSSNVLASLSPFGRPLFNNVESTMIDPAQYLDTFDFDLSAVGGESVYNFNASSAAIRDLPSPKKAQISGSTTEVETANPRQFSVGEAMGEDRPAISGLSNTSPTEILMWSNDHSPSVAAGSMRRSGPLNPLTETLDKLSELQTFIFKEFGCIPEDKLARTFLSPGTGSYHGLGGASQDSDLVGQVLYASELLTDILASCGRNEVDIPSTSPPSRFRSDSLSSSKRTHSDFIEDEELLHADRFSSGFIGCPSPMADTLTTHSGILRKNNANPSNGRPPPPPMRTSSTRFNSQYTLVYSRRQS